MAQTRNTGGLQPTDVGAELIADGLEHGSAIGPRASGTGCSAVMESFVTAAQMPSERPAPASLSIAAVWTLPQVQQGEIGLAPWHRALRPSADDRMVRRGCRSSCRSMSMTAAAAITPTPSSLHRCQVPAVQGPETITNSPGFHGRATSQ